MLIEDLLLLVTAQSRWADKPMNHTDAYRRTSRGNQEEDKAQLCVLESS